MRRILILFALLLICDFTFAQTCEDKAVEVTAMTSTSPARITLKWKRLTFNPTITYSIWKKSKTAASWGLSIATLPYTDSQYVDTAVIVDSAYEYYIRALATSVTFSASGFIYAGIKAPAIHNRGALILIVDSTFTVPCAPGIKKMMDDISGDGWEVIRHDFLRTKSVVDVKAAIANDYATHANVKAVMLLGHIAVPYSGELNPDAHPDHLGAWPADVFYGSIAGSWTDATVNNSSASYVANRNTPGDGKYDQTQPTTAVELQVSRIDFYDMPAFSNTEVQMMDNYLAKDHTYKMDSLTIVRRARISDNFGYMSGEAFAANGWRNFPPLLTRDSISTTTTLIADMASTPYQWAYGCGGGSFTSCSGVGNTGNFVTSGSCNAIFTMLFGSYFGDWNVTNNFLRAPLCCNPPALTNCWAGRPNWFFHHMALGENIGYSARLTQNNLLPSGIGPYLPENYMASAVHIALMGDLSLRTDYVKPAINLNVTIPTTHGGATLNWTASPDAGVIGYYVYRADSAYGYYKRLNSTIVTTTSYNDYTATTGLKYYMVRPVKLASTPSGGYYNLGIGITDTGTVIVSALDIAQVQTSVEVSVFPNPAENNLNVSVSVVAPCTATMYVLNTTGQVSDMVTKQLNAGDNKYSLNIAAYAPGVYSLVIKAGEQQVVKKWVKL